MSEAYPNSLEDWAARAPDKAALIEGDRALTFAQWNGQADRLAHGLAARGVAAGHIIVARTHTRLEWPLIQAAAAKLGCRLLVLNWRLTPAEIAHVLGDSAAHAFICDDADPIALEPALTGRPLKLRASVDVEAPGFERFDALFAEGPALFAAGDAPLIVYTSGTTGLPKGVEAPPRTRPAASASADEVALINMPMHHASAPNQLVRCRTSGWTVVLQPRFDAEQALALIQRYRVSQWGSVPTMLKRIMGLPPQVREAYDVSCLKSVSTGAGPSPFSLKQEVIGWIGPNKLTENYGTTEVGLMTNLPAELQEAKPGSCGKALSGVVIEIRDEADRLLPPGEVGVIWTRTPGTIDRYLNDDGAMADRWDARGFFKVGDLGRLDDEGFLYLTDRAIDLIVSGGVNIYPAEIEAVFMRHPAVQDVAVVGGPNEEFGEEVIAFVELKRHLIATPAELAAWTAEDLASYKRPRRIEIVEELPRNTMGKLLKRELRAPLWAS